MLILETNRDITGRKRAAGGAQQGPRQLESDLDNMTLLHEVSMRFVQQDDLMDSLSKFWTRQSGSWAPTKEISSCSRNDGCTLRLDRTAWSSKTSWISSVAPERTGGLRNRSETRERVTVEMSRPVRFSSDSRLWRCCSPRATCCSIDASADTLRPVWSAYCPRTRRHRAGLRRETCDSRSPGTSGG